MNAFLSDANTAADLPKDAPGAYSVETRGNGSTSESSSAIDLDNFVDLYNLLNLPTSSTRNELRHMISSLYLDAQKNQDHRNPQKKLFFQQMYEVYLPRARHILLDDKRRLEYDEHVNTFREDRAPRNGNAKTTNPTAPATSELPAQNADVSTSEPKDEIEDLTPEQLAAQRENLWGKWQQNLEAPAEAIVAAPQLVFTPQQIVREEKRNVYMRKTAKVVREVERVRREESARRQQSRWEEQQKAQDEARQIIENERKQQEEKQRQKLAHAKIARTRWSWSSGIGIFAVGAALIFALVPTSSTRSVASSADTMLGHRPYHGVPSPLPGTIELEDYDLGMESTAYHKKTRTINGGGAYRSGSGVFMTDTNSGHAVTKTAAGEWLDYTINVAQSGNYDMRIVVASPQGGGTFSLSFNGQNASGALVVPPTGDYDTYQTVVKNVALNAGRQIMRLSFDSASGDGSAGNFDSLEAHLGAQTQVGLLTRIGAFARFILLLPLALCCALAGRKIGENAEKRTLKST